MKVCTPRASGFCMRASLGTTRDFFLALQRFAASRHSCKTQILKCPEFLSSSGTATWAKLGHWRMTITVRLKKVSSNSYLSMSIFPLEGISCWTSNLWLVLGCLSWVLGWGVGMLPFWTHLISTLGSNLQRDIPFYSAGNSGLERKITDNLN